MIFRFFRKMVIGPFKHFGARNDLPRVLVLKYYIAIEIINEKKVAHFTTTAI